MAVLTMLDVGHCLIHIKNSVDKGQNVRDSVDKGQDVGDSIDKGC